MNPQDPLAALNPLREPPPIDWWPPAPGWWVVLALVLLAITALAVVWHRKRQQSAYRRHALAQLKRLREQHRAPSSAGASEKNTQFVAALNALLKRVALLAYPQKDVAALHGKQWLVFLNQSAPGQPPFAESFAQGHYLPPGREDTNHQEIERLYNGAQHWIKHHKVMT